MNVEKSGQDLDKPSFLLQGVRYSIIRKRWGLLALSCCMIFPDLLAVTYFEFFNDVASLYFQVEPAVIDLQATLNMVAKMICVVMVVISGRWLTVRNMAVLGTATNMIAFLLIIVGLVVKQFALVVAGTFVNGCASSVLLPLLIAIPINWFPPKERGKANAAPWTARRLSLLIGPLIATMTISVSHTGNNQISESTAGGLNPKDVPEIKETFKTASCSLFGALAFLSTTWCILAIIYAREHPPVHSELDDTDSVTNETSPMLPKTKTYSFKGELKDLKFLFSSPAFLIMFAIFCFQLTIIPITSLLTTSLILKEFPQTNDKFIGLFVSAGVITSMVLTPITGIILDKFSKPRITFLFITGISIASLALFSIFLAIHNQTGVFAAYVAVWSMRDSMLACSSHRLSTAMSPQPEAIRNKAFTIASVSSVLGLAISTVFIRILMDRYNSAIAVLFPMPFLISCGLFYIIFWSHISHGE